MNKTGQLNFDHNHNEYCPFKDYIEPNDHHCYNDFSGNNGYKVISENSSDLALWLSRLGGVGFENLTNLKPTPILNLPPFIPTISRGSSRVFNRANPECVGINLNRIYSCYKNGNSKKVRELLGINPSTKLILFNYGKDSYIEKIWQNRPLFYRWIGEQNFDAVTGINYSVWYNQPHGERLINVKRNLITFKDMQDFGIPAIPHIYWFGEKDIIRITEWLSKNPNVKTIAINLQTHKTKSDWERVIQELEHFADKAPSDIHYIINGPTTQNRINEIKSALKSRKYTLSNSYCASSALCRRALSLENNTIVSHLSNMDKGEIFEQNLATYQVISYQPGTSIPIEILQTLSKFGFTYGSTTN